VIARRYIIYILYITRTVYSAYLSLCIPVFLFSKRKRKLAEPRGNRNGKGREHRNEN
jgi:hypothetical protein